MDELVALKDALKQHREHPLNDDFRAQFLEIICFFITNLDSHFFCKFNNIKEVLGVFALLEKSPIIDRVKNKLMRDLGSCVDCIDCYYSCCREFLIEQLNNFDESIMIQFEKHLSNWNAERHEIVLQNFMRIYVDDGGNDEKIMRQNILPTLYDILQNSTSLQKISVESLFIRVLSIVNKRAGLKMKDRVFPSIFF